MNNEIKKIIAFTDGGARGNPGPAGIGAVLYDDKGKKIAEISKYIGPATNNQAEYQAVLAAMEKIKELGIKQAEFFLDSELVVKQMNREYRVKNQDLAPFFVKIYNLTLQFDKITFNHIPREKNKDADKLVNLAIDAAK